MDKDISLVDQVNCRLFSVERVDVSKAWHISVCVAIALGHSLDQSKN